MPHGIMSRIPRKLPHNSNPQGFRCIQITIPDDDEYERDLYSVILGELTRWISWELDEGHNATKVAQVWKRALRTFRHCDLTIPAAFGGLEDDMPFFRIVEDAGECWLEFECCPDEWIRLARADQVPAGGQPGTGTGGTPAPGKSAQNCFKLDASKQTLLPLTVNTGDQITLDSCNGAAWDGVEGSPLGVWRLGKNGDQFFAGLDVGLPRTESTDPVNTAPHMSILAVIGTTPVYLALPFGTPATVPSVPTNSQVSIQVNDQPVGDNQGSEDVCITVKNNAVGTWTHTFDFTLSPQGFAPIVGSVGPGHWEGGVGWVSDPYTAHGSPPQNMGLEIYILTSSATPITSGSISYHLPTSADNAWNVIFNIRNGGNAGTIVSTTTLATGAGDHLVQPITAYGSSTWDCLTIEMQTDRQDVDPMLIMTLTLSGPGADPF